MAKKTIIDKSIKLDSGIETYYTFTGSQFIDNCVRSFDYWLALNDKKNDFISGFTSIGQLQNVIQRMIATFPGRDKLNLKDNRLFFIDKNNVV